MQAEAEAEGSEEARPKDSWPPAGGAGGGGRGWRLPTAPERARVCQRLPRDADIGLAAFRTVSEHFYVFVALSYQTRDNLLQQPKRQMHFVFSFFFF